MRIMFGNGAAWRAVYAVTSRGTLASVGIDPSWRTGVAQVWLNVGRNRKHHYRLTLWHSRHWYLFDGRHQDTRWTVPIGAAVTIALLAYVATLVS